MQDRYTVLIRAFSISFLCNQCRINAFEFCKWMIVDVAEKCVLWTSTFCYLSKVSSVQCVLLLISFHRVVFPCLQDCHGMSTTTVVCGWCQLSPDQVHSGLHTEVLQACSGEEATTMLLSPIIPDCRLIYLDLLQLDFNV